MSDLRVVAVGDSVMWGQGLAARSVNNVKFVDIVAHGLGSTAENLAHSGATIVGASQSGLPPGLSATARGEVPHEAPSVLTQLDSIQDPTSVDLLLVNGGANDWGFVENLANPLRGRRGIDRTIRAVFGERPKELIKAARRTCSQALIVYTGYYQGISRDTKTKHMKHMLMWRLGKAAFEAGGGATGTGITVGVQFLLWSEIERGMLRKTYHWAHQQLRWLRTAVSECNADPNLRGPGIIFAHPRFLTEHALGSKRGTSHVFSHVSAFSPDDQLGLRTTACRKVYPRHHQVLARETCRVAATFHPNAAGARKYATRIRKELERTAFGRSLSLRSIGEELPSARGSLRSSLTRHGLFGTPSRGASVRETNQHLQIDFLEVEFELRKVEAAAPGSPMVVPVPGMTLPDNITRFLPELLRFGVSSARWWTLTERQGRAAITNPPAYSLTPHTYRFFIDPNLGDEEHVPKQPLRLSDIRTIRLSTMPLPVASRFTIDQLRVKLNGHHVIYDTGPNINTPVTSAGEGLIRGAGAPLSLVSGAGGLPAYPLPE